MPYPCQLKLLFYPGKIAIFLFSSTFTHQISIFDIPLFLPVNIPTSEVFTIENRHITRELYEESEAGVLPKEFIPFITSVFRRKSFYWLPQGINGKSYVKKAITLGLRKFQFKHSVGLANAKYKYEVDKLRYELQKMLYDATISPQRSI